VFFSLKKLAHIKKKQYLCPGFIIMDKYRLK